ncbi:PH domain-containing protein [Streptomyces yunnanensis]|uniref:PH domain-containing protein n=1 Tax=Streptomyces yunnanensis TaxID=156453 RepID=A0A9X8N7I9_9ACTN|nr:PH domain-containing protein [Streptomyces yunnanensis]SHN22640.1 PH domain-containing protein [Streptomyces yunnanensis]
MTIDEDVHFPEYRAPAGCLGGLALPSVGLTGILAGLAQISRNGAPLWLLLALPAFLILVFLLLRIASGRVATFTGPDGITVRRPFGERRTVWPDIQAIEIHSNPSAVADSGMIAEFVVLYDRDGRRLLLPHLNSKTVFGLHEDVARLRELWEHLRGTDWVALPEVAEKIARTRRGMRRQRGLVVGVAVGGGVAMVGLVLFLVLVLTGALDGVGVDALPLVAVGFVAVGGAVGAVLGQRSARRGERLAAPRKRRTGLHR